MRKTQSTSGQELRDEVTAALAVLLFTDTAQDDPCEVLIKALLTIKEHKGLAAVERVLERTINDLSAIAERVQDEIERQDTAAPILLN